MPEFKKNQNAKKFIKDKNMAKQINWEYKFTFEIDSKPEDIFDNIKRQKSLLGYILEVQKEKEYTDYYFDSNQLDIESSGIVCRIRNENNQYKLTLKKAGQGPDKAHLSPAYRYDKDITDKDFSELTAADLNLKTLFTLFDDDNSLKYEFSKIKINKNKILLTLILKVTRSVLLLKNNDNKTIATINLDKIEAKLPNEEEYQYKEYELELKSPKEFYPHVQEIRTDLIDKFSLIPMPKAKFRRMASLIGIECLNQPEINDHLILIIGEKTSTANLSKELRKCFEDILSIRIITIDCQQGVIDKDNWPKVKTIKTLLLIIDSIENADLISRILDKASTYYSIDYVPAFIINDKFTCNFSKDVWRIRNVVGYVIRSDSKLKYLNEIRNFVIDRISKFDRAMLIKEKPFAVSKIGSLVSITPDEFQHHNLVSLFIGNMRDFMVKLKLLCDPAKLSQLEPNYYKQIKNIEKFLETEKEIRLGKLSQDTSNEKNFFTLPPQVRNKHTILIRGQSGTGKSVIAEFIHEYIYAGKDKDKEKGNLKTVFCTNIGKDWLESELFGSMTGSFTDAITQPGAIIESYNGTLFLDEIGDLSLKHQSKLLQYLQDGVVAPVGWVGNPIYIPNVIVAATNKNLEQMVQDGTFREDLYYRLGVYLEIPSLESRLNELDRIIDFILQNPSINPVKVDTKKGDEPIRFVNWIENSVFDLLKTQKYPGNIRQLEHILRLAVVQARFENVDVLLETHVKKIFRR
ncbi:MAG: sigma 54-interacting transcriptional regulator [Desulfobacterales bacterium]|nr:sigma 54-interacting transcriptional regulator [Desulfobacterales bacterium]